MQKQIIRIAFLALAAAVLVAPALAEVKRVVVESREDLLDGKPFGMAGAYEKITGRIHFAWNPSNAANKHIVDLDKAPRNGAGMVEASANFMVLRPKDPAKGSGVALLEVSNRGGKALLSYFNRARGAGNPVRPENFGDGFLMRRGLTLIWVGWQFDVPVRQDVLRMIVPVATDDGQKISGLVRADWTQDGVARTLEISHRNHVAYPVADPDSPENVLTVRDGRLAERRVVPRDKWRFAREENGRVVEDRTHIYMQDGFQAGKIYELVYRAENPAVVGLGLAGIRDTISYAKYDKDSLFPVRAAVALGISQTGRFLRHFIYQGFNTDEQGRKAFDGLMIHTAGAGRGSFNHRFAQPSRDAHRYSAFFYPTDLFPFSGRTQSDTETGTSDGLFARTRTECLPKIFYTNTGYEYWGRAASLIHTTPDGKGDIELMPNERIYHLAGGQHFVGRFPPPANSRLGNGISHRGNPLDFLVTMRALLVRMQEWMAENIEPPPSAYPKIADGTLVPISRAGFPAIPGVDFPKVIHEAYRADYGPRWSEGIITREPPELGKPFLSQVSRADELGNEVAGVRAVELLAPLATYAPWNLRTGAPGATDELTDFVGTYIPLSRTEVEKSQRKDPRASIESLYKSKADYIVAATQAAIKLVESGYLLHEDIPAVIERADRHWEWIMRQ